jgi:VIT1/CCC1 family predicted Fe2+/Mn2+ transporter
MRAEAGSPIVNSFITFFSFSLFGFVPLIPLIISSRLQFVQKHTYVILSGILTMITLFILGFSKSMIVKSKWYISSF